MINEMSYYKFYFKQCGDLGVRAERHIYTKKNFAECVKWTTAKLTMSSSGMTMSD